jgi:hypothetical protein
MLLYNIDSIGKCFSIVYSLVIFVNLHLIHFNVAFRTHSKVQSHLESV